MIDTKTIADFFKENRLFQNYEYVYEISSKLIAYIEIIQNSNNQEDFVILLYGLDDNTGLFEFTQPFCDCVVSFYHKNPSIFFNHFLENIQIIDPHAIQLTADIFSPILYNYTEASKILCDSLNNVEMENLTIFKKVYIEVIKQNGKLSDDCILKKLELVV